MKSMTCFSTFHFPTFAMCVCFILCFMMPPLSERWYLSHKAWAPGRCLHVTTPPPRLAQTYSLPLETIWPIHPSITHGMVARSPLQLVANGVGKCAWCERCVRFSSSKMGLTGPGGEGARNPNELLIEWWSAIVSLLQFVHLPLLFCVWTGERGCCGHNCHLTLFISSTGGP